MFSKKGSIFGKGVFGFFEKWVNFWGVNFWHPTVQHLTLETDCDADDEIYLSGRPRRSAVLVVEQSNKGKAVSIRAHCSSCHCNTPNCVWLARFSLGVHLIIFSSQSNLK